MPKTKGSSTREDFLNVRGVVPRGQNTGSNIHLSISLQQLGKMSTDNVLS